MGSRTAAVAVVLTALVSVGPARAAPEWLGQTIEREGRSSTRCTGPAMKFTIAYQGEADGSKPAVGDVYLVRFMFENLGNCVGNNLGETGFRFNPEFTLPKRHAPVHDFKYGADTHRIRCLLRDPAGAEREIPGENCARRLARGLGSRWIIETATGNRSGPWEVPRGHTLDVQVPVIALDPMVRDDKGIDLHVGWQMNTLGAGFDFALLQQPMLVAASPLLVTAPMVEQLTATSARLSADFFTRFMAGESYIQLEPAPMFDSVRVAPASATTHNGRITAYWGDLTPDTEYRWRGGILVGATPLHGEYQTFRTPPATGARLVSPATGGQGAATTVRERAEAHGQQAACSFVRSAGGGIVWPLLLGAVLAGLGRRRRHPGALWLAIAAVALTAACPGGEDPAVDAGMVQDGGPLGGGGTGGNTPVGGSGGGSVDIGPLALTFLRAQPGLFTVPEGWQVNQASLKAWQVDGNHVVTMSPPDRPDVVLGVRQFLTNARPARVIELAALQGEVVEVLENQSGGGEGFHSRWLARVTLEGKPAAMGMYSWGTLGNDQGRRLVMLAALVTPTVTEFERLGGRDTLRRLAYGQSTHEDGAPELVLAGKFKGAEATAGFTDPVTGSSSSAGFGMTLTLTGNQISVFHYDQVTLGYGQPSGAGYTAKGTFIQDGGMIIPAWVDCSVRVTANGSTGPPSACEAGWGATIHLIPRSDGSFLARMPGMESVGDVDEPGTVILRREP